MELQENRGSGPVIERYESGQLFRIDQHDHTGSVLLQAEKSVAAWPPQTYTQIDAAAIGMIVELQPQVVLLGTGDELQLLEPSLLEPLYQQQIGVELMTTAAACRTYNLLMAESRAVVAALIL